MPRDIPGFYFDAAKNRYFKVVNTPMTDAEVQYSTARVNESKGEENPSSYDENPTGLPILSLPDVPFRQLNMLDQLSVLMDKPEYNKADEMFVKQIQIPSNQWLAVKMKRTLDRRYLLQQIGEQQEPRGTYDVVGCTGFCISTDQTLLFHDTDHGGSVARAERDLYDFVESVSRHPELNLHLVMIPAPILIVRSGDFSLEPLVTSDGLRFRICFFDQVNNLLTVYRLMSLGRDSKIVQVRGHFTRLIALEYLLFIVTKLDGEWKMKEESFGIINLHLDEEPLCIADGRSFYITDDTFFVGTRKGHIHILHGGEQLGKFNVGASVCQMTFISDAQLLVSSLNDQLAIYTVIEPEDGKLDLVPYMVFSGYHNRHSIGMNFQTLQDGMFAVQVEENGILYLQLYYKDLPYPLQWGNGSIRLEIGESGARDYFKWKFHRDALFILASDTQIEAR